MRKIIGTILFIFLIILSTAGVAAYVMQEAGLKMTPYQKFLMRLYEKLPVLSAMGAYDAEGNYYESAKETPYKKSRKERRREWKKTAMGHRQRRKAVRPEKR